MTILSTIIIKQSPLRSRAALAALQVEVSLTMPVLPVISAIPALVDDRVDGGPRCGCSVGQVGAEAHIHALSSTWSAERRRWGLRSTRLAGNQKTFSFSGLN